MLRVLTPVQRAVDLAIAAAYLLLFSTLLRNTDGAFAARLVEVALLGAALALRRWSPGIAVALAWCGGIVEMVTGLEPSFENAAILVVVGTAADLGGRRVRWAAFASSVAAAPIAGVYVIRSELRSLVSSDSELARQTWSNLVLFSSFVAVSLLLSWTVGLLISTARQSGVRARAAEEATREVVAEQERVRIARDMHDVVAHSLAVVIAQSDGARLLQGRDPEAVDEALGTIGAVSRAALADVRVLLQQLRYRGTTAVQPTLADLDALVEQFRASGLDVAVQRRGGVDGLGAAVQLAAYRIAQESLTNALRHADTARPVDLRLDRDDEALALSVSSTLPGDVPARTGGHGLIGMRERAQTVGGDLTAAPAGDRFVVSARLPVAELAGVGA